MSDVVIDIEGCAGVITLNRPQALNALTYEMCLEIDAALREWRDDPEIALVIVEGEGERAFCAGGDIAEMYRSGKAGDYDYGRRFWHDEYRMNALFGDYPKPIVSWLHGFVMGGGVGVGCHGSHRLVTESSQIAMPECGIGLIPDVGGSYLLSKAPGHLGEYLGLTGARMGPADAILAGFADRFVPADRWQILRDSLVDSGDVDVIDEVAEDPPEGRYQAVLPQIDSAFSKGDLSAIATALEIDGSDFAMAALAAMMRNAPLSMAATLELLNEVRGGDGLRDALAMEYRFTYRAMEEADFLEGIRAQIIDKDRDPHWRHAGEDVPEEEVDAMLAPLGEAELTFEEE
ncbi:enoyl-CoA hydratase/isomerase family protein [Acidimangrovimonas pyrenivorans]|uniref:3-hydroxyisobutyryl-CoA hydrolase n=1 Tax=Acidimangrovimonas pyrenivorans TaxID=2030798 RepID=A0ABV7ADX6_9RHOB